MTRQQICSFVAVAVFSLTPLAVANAQKTETSPKIAPGTMIEPSKTFEDMLDNLQKEFTSAAEAMPAEKYSFAPASTAPAKFDGVRTFAQEITHVAEANYYYGGAIGKMKPEVDLKAVEALTGKAEILKALADSFVFLHKAFATLTTQNAFESTHGDSTRAALAGGVVAHAFDHYGQMVEYLRMNGIVPPASSK